MLLYTSIQCLFTIAGEFNPENIYLLWDPRMSMRDLFVMWIFLLKNFIVGDIFTVFFQNTFLLNIIYTLFF